MVQLLDLRKKLVMKFVFIQLMQELGITVGVNMHFLWKLGNIIAHLYFWQKVVWCFLRQRILHWENV